MAPIQSLDVLLYTLAMGVLMWLGKVLGKWWDTRSEERRQHTDRLARAEREVRLLTESLHVHRVEMLKSGQWTQGSLPPFKGKNYE